MRCAGEAARQPTGRVAAVVRSNGVDSTCVSTLVSTLASMHGSYGGVDGLPRAYCVAVRSSSRPRRLEEIIMAIIHRTPQDEALAGAGDRDPIFGFGDNDWDDRHLLGNITHAAFGRTLGGFPEAQPCATVVASPKPHHGHEEEVMAGPQGADEHPGANGGRRRPATRINRLEKILDAQRRPGDAVRDPSGLGFACSGSGRGTARRSNCKDQFVRNLS